ncbi:selection and upkeep of intraepithelial T-cells protein 8-like [Simochromis diagramma]|uniref:selection and upkeep of intraepithelial T-cells protein 8-like n=1 Tax=Simochromis diagramma TaxID=43689 RepID=UPI001A7EE259|nr:selection and upkeep of intraepithelial T-cells protein 8-like [Simochromis diagramma]
MSVTVGALIVLFYSIAEVSQSVHVNLKATTATVGQNITLQCQALHKKLITVVEWSRADLQDEYVFLFLDGHSDRGKQHPYFIDRVDLQDKQMKDGDVSLILTNVNINDTGTYECRVATGTNRKRRAHLETDPISIIYLHVVPPGE